MLEVLCGNKSVQKILIFLFVNGRCYGTQLHRSLQTPLTPIQKALGRLEKGGLITSYYEGKTRLYQFNPAYPLLDEVENLLKKAYTLMPAQEKREYYVIREELTASGSRKNNMQILNTFWDKLIKVTKINFRAKTKSKEDQGWNGKGSGDVTAARDGNQLVFNEKGTWLNKQGIKVNFTNIFRWTLNRDAGVISLEHLRRGSDHPVFLFDLAPSGSNSLSSVDSHLCGWDTYFGQIHFDQYSLRLNWRVIGPKKNEEIDYHYSK